MSVDSSFTVILGERHTPAFWSHWALAPSTVNREPDVGEQQPHCGPVFVPQASIWCSETSEEQRNDAVMTLFSALQLLQRCPPPIPPNVLPLWFMHFTEDHGTINIRMYLMRLQVVTPQVPSYVSFVTGALSSDVSRLAGPHLQSTTSTGKPDT